MSHAGGMIPETCPPVRSCGTVWPIYMRGENILLVDCKGRTLTSNSFRASSKASLRGERENGLCQRRQLLLDKLDHQSRQLC